MSCTVLYRLLAGDAALCSMRREQASSTVHHIGGQLLLSY
jgi:hypothetical protein